MENQQSIEEAHPYHFSMKYQVDEVLFQGQSDFQRVDVVRTKGLGAMLLNDGLVMISEKDEFIYHDMIAHVPLFTHPHPKKVLVIGGGDGGTAREVLRHPSVERCVMVEIDSMVVEACREHIPQTSKSLDNPKLELLIEDGVRYMAEGEETFDVILVDSTDPIGPAQPLFGAEFYEDVERRLTEEGIVVAQGESIFDGSEMQEQLLAILNKTFSVTGLYNYNNLTYPGGFWSFVLGSKGPHPLHDFDERRVSRSGLEFQYYNPLVHRGAFALPTFQRKKVEKYLSS